MVRLSLIGVVLRNGRGTVRKHGQAAVFDEQIVIKISHRIIIMIADHRAEMIY